MRSKFKFEEMLPWFDLRGTLEVLEDMPPGSEPSNIIRIDQSWRVKFNFKTGG